MIVAIEGIDASGKATQTEAVRQFFLREQFSSQIKTVKKHDFPHYQTQAGGVVGKILRGEMLVVSQPALNYDLHELCSTVSRRDTTSLIDSIGTFQQKLKREWTREKAIIIQSVMICDRLEHLPMLVEFAMDPSNLLILDRFKMSGVAYGVADGLDLQWVDMIQSCIPDADLNIMLDISVEESKRRRPERRDYYETNFEKLEHIREIYLAEFSRRADASAGEYLILDGSIGPDSLKERIVSAIWKRMNIFSDG